MQILIQNATLLFNGKHYNKKKDVLINKGKLIGLDSKITPPKNCHIINVKDTYISPGWVAFFNNFCEPGFEDNETIKTGLQAASVGGFTDAFIIPNTLPTCTTASQISFIKNKAQGELANIHPIGAISKKIEGQSLAEMYDMQQAGAVAFSDGLLPVQNDALLLKALQYVKSFDGIIVQQPIHEQLTKHGLMHEGVLSTSIGLAGMASVAEHIVINRDIELAKYTSSRLHITGVSTQKGISLIKQAKKEKVNITCSVTPYHLLFTDKDIANYNTNFKVNPPLRTEADRKALIKGLEDGTIDAIATHHIPQKWDNKTIEFEYAALGMATLETTLHMLLSAPDLNLTANQLKDLLSNNWRTIFNLNQPELTMNEDINCTIFSTSGSSEFNKIKKSLGTNNPFENKQLNGRIIGVVNNQKVHLNHD
jgi:dihydroorotase